MFNLEEKIKKYLKNISKDRVVTDFFRNIIKPFLANTTHFNGKEIILIIDKETKRYCQKDIWKKTTYFNHGNISNTTQAIDLIF